MTKLEWIMLGIVLCQLAVLLWIAIRATETSYEAADFCDWASKHGWNIRRADEFETARSAYCRQCFLGRR